MAKYLDLKPSEVNVDEIIKAVYVALAPFAERGTPGANVTIEVPLEYYPGAFGWTIWFSVDPHWESWTLNSPNFGRVLITFDVEQNETNDRPHADDEYESFLNGRVVELSAPTRNVTLPSAPFLTQKPGDYEPPPPPF